MHFLKKAERKGYCLSWPKNIAVQIILMGHGLLGGLLQLVEIGVEVNGLVHHRFASPAHLGLHDPGKVVIGVDELRAVVFDVDPSHIPYLPRKLF